MINTDTTGIDKFIQDNCLAIENHLDSILREDFLPCASLIRAARYSLLSSAKRLRPLLAICVADAFGVDVEIAIKPSLALELIHTYSLIHDDLPCMDDDDFRRGKPSLHKAFPESHAVLAGDFLLTYAFEIITTAPFLTATQKIDLVQTLSRFSGSDGMIGGQIMDIEAEGKKISLDYLRSLHEKKTGALIVASVLFGGIVANARPKDLESLKSFGLELGFAFQVIDDVLDVTNQKNSDVKNGKTTYVTLLGVERSKELALEHLNKAVKHIETADCDCSKLVALAKTLVFRNK